MSAAAPAGRRRDGGDPQKPASGGATFPRLEKYELLEEIGHGGMATVYRARDPRLGRDVAVKLIHRHLRENAEVGTRFVAEARAAAKLRHPGIVDVFDVSNEDDPERYLVVELIRGTTLRKVLVRHRDMPAEVGAAIVQQLCDAVDHAHALAVIHRDIKPENVLVELPSDRLAPTPEPPAIMGDAPKPPATMGDAPKPPATMGDAPKPPAVTGDTPNASGAEAGEAAGDGRGSGVREGGERATPSSGPTGRREPEAAHQRTGGVEAGVDGEPSAGGDTQASPRGMVAVGGSATEPEPHDGTPRGMRAHGGKASTRKDPAATLAGARERPPTRARPVDPGVVIKITDFGIAKILDAQGVTSTGQVLGSPAHMAPEQIEGGDVDPRTDVFALGVLLYECLVGHLPFEGKNPAQVLRRVLEGAYPAPDRERPSVGGRWGRIVASALAHDPAERFASAAQLGEAIRAELAALGCPDGRAEIAAYFADPAGYAEAHKALLVPRLTARGEAARKAGDVWGAAADYNRALALAPDDLAILKRIAGLNSSRGRRLLLRRAALILAGSAALGVAAFVVARTFKARAVARDPGALSSASAAPPVGDGPSAGGTTVPADVTAAAQRDPRLPPTPAASGSADPSRPLRIAAMPSFSLAPPVAVPATRAVVFTVTPAGAKLAVDGVERPWFQVEMQLQVGPHNVEATPTDPRCCKKTAGTVVVQPPPADKPNEAQRIPFPMEIAPATVSLAASAPRGALLECKDIGLKVAPGRPVEARLRGLIEWTGACRYTAPDRPARLGSVSLKAGESKTIPWPD